MPTTSHILQILCAALTAAVFSACTPGAPVSEGTPLRLKHATLLSIAEADSFTCVTVNDAWHPGSRLATYVLVPRDKAVPANRPEGTLVRTPQQRIAITSSVHAALLADLHAEAAIAGMSDTAYLVSPRLKALARRVSDLGSSMQPDVEKLRAIHADAIWVSPFENAGHGALDRLGVPLIECADYMETSPLGRAEWMRLYGRLTGRAKEADSLFAAVEKAYISLKIKAKDATPRPAVFCDLRTGSVWYQPGGESTMGRYIQDAGGKFLWGYRTESGSIPLTLESVYARARHADIWLVKYGQPLSLSYAQMAEDCPQYRQFDAWKRRRIMACNTLYTPFYEETPFHPELLLHNLIHLFHPQLVETPTALYYRAL